MKRMIPSSKLTIKNDKLTAMEGIYDAEGNQIIADGGSLVAGNPEVPAGTSPTELSGLSIQNDSTKQYFKITHSPVVEANPVVPEGTTPTALSGLKVGSDYYGVSAGGSEVVAYEGTSTLPAGVEFSGWTLHRAIKDGNILWIVIAGYVNNTSESSASVQGLMNITFPADISSKIYRVDGSNLSTNQSSDSMILTGVYVVDSTNTNRVELYSSSANTMIVAISGSLAISANSRKRIDFRIPIFLDIGE